MPSRMMYCKWTTWCTSRKACSNRRSRRPCTAALFSHKVFIMNLSQLLLILRARKKIIITTLLVVVALTLGGSLVWPKSYKATASMLLNYKGVDPLTGLTMPGQLLPGYMATQIDIISSKKVALLVVDRLQMAKNPAVIEQFNEATEGKGTIRDWLADL